MIAERCGDGRAAGTLNPDETWLLAGKQRKRAAHEEVDELEAELDEELDEGGGPGAGRVGGLAAAMKASAERSRRRRYAAEQWQRHFGNR